MQIWRLQVTLHGVIPVEDGGFRPLQQSSAYWNVRLRQAAAVCNSLTWVPRTSLAGDDLERRLFHMVEARFLVSSPNRGTDAPNTKPVHLVNPCTDCILLQRSALTPRHTADGESLLLPASNCSYSLLYW